MGLFLAWTIAASVTLPQPVGEVHVQEHPEFSWLGARYFSGRRHASQSFRVESEEFGGLGEVERLHGNSHPIPTGVCSHCPSKHLTKLGVRRHVVAQEPRSSTSDAGGFRRAVLFISDVMVLIVYLKDLFFNMNNIIRRIEENPHGVPWGTNKKNGPLGLCRSMPPPGA
jgi:hypothetical protein